MAFQPNNTIIKILTAILILAGGILVASMLLYRVSSPPAPVKESGKIIVAAIGDSNTYGYGVLMDNLQKNSYPAQLQALLGDNYQVLNFGLGGRTLLSSGDKPYIKEKFYVESQTVKPDIVLIMLGTNDAKPQNWNARRFETELAAFVYTYKRLPNAPAVYLLTIPYARDIDVIGDRSTRIDGRIVKNEVVPIIKRVAITTRTTMIDVYDATQRRPDLFPDGVHPNAEGYGIIAGTVYKRMRQQ